MATCRITEFRPMGGTAEARIHALERAVAELTRELTYVLSHLDGANFSPEEQERFISEICGRVKEAVEHGTTS